ncbi:MAG: carbohydrate kinase family protein [Vicinamibacterales bacterium]|nr:carbohydrate kinase family protein [Vicinamibacterales bacterium]|tara:strand:- start:1762 stop:2742 length:981 start_codon:yes stop_codon:yes gene_type:complete
MIVCCGAIVQDCFLHAEPADKGTLSEVERLRYSTGGAPSNVGRALGKLGIGVEAVGCVGADPAGRWIVDALRTAGVGTGGVQVVEDGTSGISMILVAPDGERTVYCYPGVNDRFDADDVEPSSDWRICHVGYPSLMPRCRGVRLARLFERLRSQGIVTSLDTTWSMAEVPLDDVEAALPHTDILTPNLGEAEQLAGTAPGSGRAEALAQFLLDRGVGTVVITRGPEGVYLATGTGRERSTPSGVALPPPGLSIHVPAYETRGILNTTGAGDTFGAGFLAGLTRGIDPEVALKVGALAAALHIEGSSVPPFDEVVGMLSGRRTIAEG